LQKRIEKEKRNELLNDFDTFYQKFIDKFQSVPDLEEEKQKQTVCLLEKINESQNGFQLCVNYILFLADFLTEKLIISRN
jgi:hypothetical protein